MQNLRKGYRILSWEELARSTTDGSLDGRKMWTVFCERGRPNRPIDGLDRRDDQLPFVIYKPIFTGYIWYPSASAPWGVAETHYRSCGNLPVIQEDQDETLCYCSGIAQRRWCFDTNKVELLCVRCRKRKEK